MAESLDDVAVPSADNPVWKISSERSDYSEVAMSGAVDRGRSVVEDLVHNDLRHYGVKGMKWGVRRSEAQLARARAAREAASDDARAKIDVVTKAKSSGTTNVLSNKELQTAITRMNLETQYSRLVEQTTPKSAGRKFAEALLGDAKGILRDQSSKVARNATSIAVEEALRKQGHEELANRIKPKKK